MRKLLAVMALFTALATAQTKEEPKTFTSYKVDFSVIELQDGKRMNVRHYSMYLRGDGREHSTKVGNRIPVATGKDGFTYMDVGMFFNCGISSGTQDGVILSYNFEVSSLVPADPNNSAVGPVVRQMRQDGIALVPLNKPTIISSSDDTNTTRTVQVEATVAQVK